MELKKFKNFKTSALSSLVIIDTILKHQTAKETKIIFKKSHHKTPGKLPNPKSTSRKHPDLVPPVLHFKNWNEKYENILRNQPVVVLKCINKVSKRKSPTQKQNLKELTTSSDFQNPDFYCSECKVTVSTKSFGIHVIQTHLRKTADQNFICDYCNKTLLSCSSAVQHFNIHRYYEGVKKCDKCPLVFTRVSQYKRHYALHRTKKHICKYLFYR